MSSLAQRVLEGEQLAAGRLIRMVEEGDRGAWGEIQGLVPYAAKAQVIGLTGPPGSGKSSLINRLAMAARREGLFVGVIAVDPSSPLSGGALLGDRIRLADHSTDPMVFIRSVATRGRLGGLSRPVWPACTVLAALGCQLILVETAGIGQSEVDVAALADLTLVVLAPFMGDEIQMMKAGILEVADLFVVNQGDSPGADLMARNLRSYLKLLPFAPPPVLITSATTGQGMEELWGRVRAEGAPRAEVRLRRARALLEAAVADRILSRLSGWFGGREGLEGLAEGLVGRQRDLDSLAEELAGEFLGGLRAD